MSVPTLTAPVTTTPGSPGAVNALVAGPAQKAPAATAVALPAVAPRPPVPVERARQVAADMEKFVRESGRNVRFQVDDGTGVVVVKIVDSASGEVIRQIPNEELLRLAQRLSEGDTDVSYFVDESA